MPTLEAQQSVLLQALWGRGVQQPIELKKYIAEIEHPTSARGLKAYQSNAHALAERALSAAYPVVTAILSAESMAQLARALWHAHPPLRGDMGLWGDALPQFVASSPQLSDLPWLGDVARVEWALHQADAAEDVRPDLATLTLLAEDDPAALTLRLAPGLRVLCNRWAVVPVLQAHRETDGAERARAIAGLGSDWCPAVTEHALVWRVGHHPSSLATIPPEEAGFLSALQAGQPLLAALEASDLDFSTWLPAALQRGWVLGVGAS